jgi:PTH1 family peptidyl-tRNA hydrolase
MKFLIVGLGNIGEGYKDTRHNIGFTVLDAMAMASNISFTDKRYGAISRMKYKGRELILLKPSTFMNLSGNAVDYWLKKENIALENMLVIVDDLALPSGSIIMATHEYPRIRIGIGNRFRKGAQIDYVLGAWDPDEKEFMEKRVAIVIDMIKSFVFAGLERTMTAFNKAGKVLPPGEETDPEKKLP